MDARCNRACQVTASILAAQGAFRATAARSVVLAQAGFRLSRAGEVRLRLTLTGKAKRLLQSSRHRTRYVITLKLVTKALAPPLTTVTRTRKIVVRRSG